MSYHPHDPLPKNRKRYVSPANREASQRELAKIRASLDASKPQRESRA